MASRMSHDRVTRSALLRTVLSAVGCAYYGGDPRDPDVLECAA